MKPGAESREDTQLCQMRGPIAFQSWATSATLARLARFICLVGRPATLTWSFVPGQAVVLVLFNYIVLQLFNAPAWLAISSEAKKYNTMRVTTFEVTAAKIQ